MKTIGRRVSVAPMMDWIDDLETSLPINLLRSPESACLRLLNMVPFWSMFARTWPCRLVTR